MYHNETERRSKVASNDLSGLLFRAVDLVGGADQRVDVADAGKGYGILVNKPLAGEDASVVVDGECEVRVGAAVVAGEWAISATSGWIVPLTAGSFQVASGAFFAELTVLGRIVTGAASGMLGVLDVDPFLVVTSG